MRPLNVAVIGMGGFAGEHHRVVQALERDGECRLVGTCDPQTGGFADKQGRWELGSRGVAVYDDYVRMLDSHVGDLDVVTVPTPVPLHAPMHRAVVGHGLACYLEKPPTLYNVELEAMIAADRAGSRQTQVGFNFIIEETRQALKGRLLAGDFGPLRRVCLLAFAPRTAAYFGRAAWAGRLLMDGRPVLDSCIGNARAHNVHNLLFWAGHNGILSWEPVDSVEAEMYRAHRIEGMDTVFLRGQCANGVEVRIAGSHACVGEESTLEWVECEKARISRENGEGFRIEWKNGRLEELSAERGDLLERNFRAYFAYVRGDVERPLTTLMDSRPFVELNDLAYLAAGQISTIPDGHVRHTQAPDGESEQVAIWRIREVMERFMSAAEFPSEQGIPWAQVGGSATRADLPRLSDVVRKLAGRVQSS